MLHSRLLVLACMLAAAVCVMAQSQGDLSPNNCRCGMKESDLPLCKDLCQKPKLTPQQKIELQAQNKDAAQNLAPDAASIVQSFLDDLQDTDHTYIKLLSGIKGGHSIRFKFLEGDESSVEVAASDLGLHVKGDSIEIPEGADRRLRQEQSADQAEHTADASQRWAAARKADQEAHGKMPEKATKFISVEQAEALVASNRAAVLKLKPYAANHIIKFLKKVYDSHNHIRLFGAIKDGHVVDYELVNGERAEVKEIGKEMGLEVNDNSISTPGDEDVSHDDPDRPQKGATGFHPHVPESEESSGACGKPRCPREGDVVIVPAPGNALRSTEPNTMILSVVTPPGGPKITNN